MSHSAEEYLKHILDETEYLLETSQNLEESKFSQNETLQKAFVRSLEIIGEAAKNLNQEFTTAHKEINWRSFAGLRDRLIHHYFGVDYAIVWDAVKNEIPRLNQYLKKILS